MAPKDFVFGHSENGWMTSQNFYEFIVNIFEPWLTKKNITRPVILFTDGHESHLTFHLSKFCAEKNIVLISLYPNATHILQPLDVAFFRPFKSQWQKINRKMCDDFSSVGIKKYQFAPMIKKTLENLEVKKLLQSGFVKCGLYPFNADAIDFTKVFQSNIKQLELEELEDKSSEKNDKERLKIFESFLTDEKIQTFRMNENSEWKGETKEESLFQIWYNLSNSNVEIVDTINNSAQFNDSLINVEMNSESMELSEFVADDQVCILVNFK